MGYDLRPPYGALGKFATSRHRRPGSHVSCQCRARAAYMPDAARVVRVGPCPALIPGVALSPGYLMTFSTSPPMILLALDRPTNARCAKPPGHATEVPNGWSRALP